MNIKQIIQEELADFTGICVREGQTELKTVQQHGIAMAWLLNKNRAKWYIGKKLLVAAYGKHQGKYFTAEIVDIISVREAANAENYPQFVEAIENNGRSNGNWIEWWLKPENKKPNNPVDMRCAIIFKKDTIKEGKFKHKFAFARGGFYYVHPKTKKGESTITIQDGGAEEINMQYIGKIVSAQIKMNGLTVIAGENDAGKSTIGKTLFSIVKGSALYNENATQQNNQLLADKIDKLYFRLRQVYDFSQNAQSTTLFKPTEFLKEIQGKSKTDLADVFKNKYAFIAKMNGNSSIELKNILQEIEVLSEPKDAKEALINSLESVFLSEFKGEISPKNKREDANKSIIHYNSGVNNILTIEIAENRIVDIQLAQNEELMFNDVVYIETPLFLQLYQLVKAANLSHVAFHITDLMEKIEQTKYVEKLFDNEEDPIVKKIIDIVKGEFVFNEEEGKKDFEFKQANGISIKPTNIASGIKSFGMIQLLKQANILNDRTLLIIDEPENHLHPKWQVAYAEILADLATEITIIINSHSPYMIQALKYYSSENENLKNKSHFYFVENEEVREVTNDLRPIFTTLAAPLHDLAWK